MALLEPPSKTCLASLAEIMPNSGNHDWLFRAWLDCGRTFACALGGTGECVSDSAGQVVWRRWQAMTEPGVAVPAEESLVYQGDVFINFRNHTYQWVLIKLFELPANADDNEVLALLTRHVLFPDATARPVFRDERKFMG